MAADDEDVAITGNDDDGGPAVAVAVDDDDDEIHDAQHSTVPVTVDTPMPVLSEGAVVEGTAQMVDDESDDNVDANVILPSPSYISSASEYENEHDEIGAVVVVAAAATDTDKASGLDHELIDVSTIEFPTLNQEQEQSLTPTTPRTSGGGNGSASASGSEQSAANSSLEVSTPGAAASTTARTPSTVSNSAAGNNKETINLSPSPPSSGSYKNKNKNRTKNKTKHAPPSQPNLQSQGQNPSMLLPPRRDPTAAAGVGVVGGDDSSSDFATGGSNFKPPPTAAASQNSINNNNNNSSYSSYNSFLKNLQHQLHNPYDSDGSDASLVFFPTPHQTEQQSQQQRRGSGMSITSTASTTKPPAAASRVGREMLLRREQQLSFNVSSIGSSIGSTSSAAGPPRTSLQQLFVPPRDRLSSVDSYQSTGSIRYVTPQSPSDHNGGTGAAIGEGGQMDSDRSGNRVAAPIQPRVLPYHERKLLQQQQQEPQLQPQLQPQVLPYQLDMQQQQLAVTTDSPTMMNQEQQQQQQQEQQAAMAAQHAQAAYFAHLHAFAQAQQLVQASQSQQQQHMSSSPPTAPLSMYPPFVDPQMMAAYYHQLYSGGNASYPPAPMNPYGYPMPLHPHLQQQQMDQSGATSPEQTMYSQQHQMTNPMMTMNQGPHYVMNPEQQRQMYEYQQQQLQFAAYQQQQIFQQQQQMNNTVPTDLGPPGGLALPPYSYPSHPQQHGLDPSHNSISLGSQQAQQQEMLHRHKRSNSTGLRLSLDSDMPNFPLQQQQNEDQVLSNQSTGDHLLASTPTITNIKNSNSRSAYQFGHQRSSSSSSRPDSFSSSGSAPPPPPPLPLAASSSDFHVRSHSGVGPGLSESLGSLSSLGSNGSRPPASSSLDLPTGHTISQEHRHNQNSSKDDVLQTATQRAGRNADRSRMIINTSLHSDAVTTPEAIRESVKHTRQNSFLNMLRSGWSPQSQAIERKIPNVDEFHRRNQEFLQTRSKRSHAAMALPAFPAGESPHHRRLGSQDHPPPSRGTHRRLSSIPQNPEGWDDGNESNSVESTSGNTARKPKDSVAKNTISDYLKRPPPPPPSNPPPDVGKVSSFEKIETASTPESQFHYTDDEEEDRQIQSKTFFGYRDIPPDADYSDDDNDEKTSLLPIDGISSSEQDENLKGRAQGNYGSQSNLGGRYDGHQPSPRSEWSSDSSRPVSPHDPTRFTDRGDSRALKLMHDAAQKTKTIRKKKYRRRSAHQATALKGHDGDEDSDEEDNDTDYRAWTMKRANMLEKERAKIIQQWKEEAYAEAKIFQEQEKGKQPYARCWESLAKVFNDVGVKSLRCAIRLEMFIANLPLTIGAVAMAVVTLGVVWFKFAEEFLSTCEPVHFHSSQCTFPEFPGCFYCDKTVIGYKIALSFHYGCKVIAGFLTMLSVAKILLATRVVMDEMSSPTTASPAGLLCMTTCVVFAGRGLVGQIMVTAAACCHLFLVIWFIYMTLAYRIMPEPSWFPNTIGIGLSAVKTWLYYPMPGHLLMAISLLLNFFFFPISLIRVATNKKISATVGWMQMGAPAIALYALTIMAQPSFEEEHPDITNFQKVHRMVYLPCMHVMCALTIVGMIASVHSLWVRWDDFSQRHFSPAHAAFAFPTLSHANAIQAYRGAVMSFSGIPSRTWPFFILDAYWLVALIGGTIATFWICGKFLYHLPGWTAPDLMDEEEPPAPYDTLLSQKDMVTIGDHLTQPYVSAAIIQANETGALVMVRNRRDGTTRFVRTRRVGALGFEPMMNWNEMQEEAEALLEWVGKHPPRRRHRTLSVPGIDFSYGAAHPFGTSNTGIYGTMTSDQQHNRHMTLGANDTRILF